MNNTQLLFLSLSIDVVQVVCNSTATPRKNRQWCEELLEHKAEKKAFKNGDWPNNSQTPFSDALWLWIYKQSPNNTKTIDWPFQQNLNSNTNNGQNPAAIFFRDQFGTAISVSDPKKTTHFQWTTDNVVLFIFFHQWRWNSVPFGCFFEAEQWDWAIFAAIWRVFFRFVFRFVCGCFVGAGFWD